MARRVGQSVSYEDFTPLSEWRYGNEAQPSHFLLVELPGFAKEQLKVSTEGIDTLCIRGQRLIEGNRWSRFETYFHIPEDCHIRGIRAKFESGILTITMPKKDLATTRPRVSPPKEATPRAHLESPLQVPNKEQEIKEKTNPKVVEEVKEMKKDEIVKEEVGNKAKEVDEGNAKMLFRPESYFEKSEKKDEETSRKVNEKENEKTQKAAKEHGGIYEEDGKEKGKGKGKGSFSYSENIEKKAYGKSGEVEEKDTEKSKKVMEGHNIKETIEKGLFEPGSYFEKTAKKVVDASGEIKEKINEKYEDAVEGFNTGSNTNEYRKAKGSLKSESYIKDDKMKAKEGTSRKEKENKNVKRKHKEVVKGISKGYLEEEEEKQLMVNMGVAILVIVALGAYITYGLGSCGKSKA